MACRILITVDIQEREAPFLYSIVALNGKKKSLFKLPPLAQKLVTSGTVGFYTFKA